MAGVRGLFRSVFPQIAVLSLFLAVSPADAVTITWTGAAGGSWHIPGSWDLNRIPGSGDDVVINDLPGTSVVTYSSGTTFVRSLTCAENFTLSGGSLSVDAASSISQSFSLFSAEFRGNGDLSITGSFIWGAGGLMNGTGVTTIGPGVNWTVNLSMFTSTLVTRVLNNDGIGLKTGPGGMTIQPDGVLRNRNGGVFNLENGTVSGGGSFENQAGAIFGRAFSGSGGISCDFSNQGTVRVAAGSLAINGVFTNFASQTLTGGTYEITGTLRFSGADIRTNAATIVLDGASSMILDSMGANALANLTTIDAAGNLTLKNARMLSTAQLLTNSGTVAIGPGGSTVLTANSGYRQIAGVTTLVNGGRLASTAFVDVQAGVLNGEGTINGNTTNGGEIAPGASPGNIFVIGNYVQTSAGVLAVEIGGLSAVTQYDRLTISGAASLDGILEMSLIDGFLPMPPDSFTIVTAVSRAGEFRAIPLVAGQNCLLATYGSTFVRLKTLPCQASQVSEPSRPAPFGITALFPNPLTSGRALRIQLSMPREQVVGLELFDVAGRRVAVRGPDVALTEAELNETPAPSLRDSTS